MSFKKNSVWVMMPVLGILLMSPKELEIKYGRHIASDDAPATETVSERSSQTPKLDKLLANVEIPASEGNLPLTKEAMKSEITGLLSRAKTATERTNDSRQADRKKLDEVKEELKSVAIKLRQIEDLISSSDDEESKKEISDAKLTLENYIGDYEGSLAEVIAREESSQEEPAIVAEAAGPARTPSVVVAETRVEEPAPVERTTPATTSREEKDPILCALEDQNKLLQQQLQNFMQQQSLIMIQLMQLNQMVMMQNMYRTPDTFNYHQMYQYQPTVAGNWVYYPNGLHPIQPGQSPQTAQQPEQQNIFGVNPYGQTPMAPNYGMGGFGSNPYAMGGYGMNAYGMGGYGMQSPTMPLQQPDMLGQNGQWGLQSQFNHAPGNFSMENMGFNFSSPAPSNFTSMTP